MRNQGNREREKERKYSFCPAATTSVVNLNFSKAPVSFQVLLLLASLKAVERQGPSTFS